MSGTWAAKPASGPTGGATTPTRRPSSSSSTRPTSSGCRRPRRSSPPCSTRRSSRTPRCSSSPTSRTSPGPRARARSRRRCAWASCGTATGASWRARPWTAAASTKGWTGSCKPFLRNKQPGDRRRCHETTFSTRTCTTTNDVMIIVPASSVACRATAVQGVRGRIQEDIKRARTFSASRTHERCIQGGYSGGWRLLDELVAVPSKRMGGTALAVVRHIRY